MPSNEQIVIAILVLIIVTLSISSYKTHTECMAEINKREADAVEAKRIFIGFVDKIKHFFDELAVVLNAANLRGGLSQETRNAIGQLTADIKGIVLKGRASGAHPDARID